MRRRVSPSGIEAIRIETMPCVHAMTVPPHARLAALRDFGGVTQAKERHRDVRSFVWLEDAWRDVRYPARLLLRNPGFTAVVVCSLALGIGANTALFSVMDALMLRPARR
jgi:hypothetical protein